MQAGPTKVRRRAASRSGRQVEAQSRHFCPMANGVMRLDGVAFVRELMGAESILFCGAPLIPLVGRRAGGRASERLNCDPTGMGPPRLASSRLLPQWRRNNELAPPTRIAPRKPLALWPTTLAGERESIQLYQASARVSAGSWAPSLRLCVARSLSQPASSSRRAGEGIELI